MWVCPITGIKIPKNPMVNLAWRAELLRKAENDPDLQQTLYTISSQSVLAWINTFVFTYRVFITGEDGVVRQCRPEESHVPFVTWTIQDKHILAIEDAINTGYELLTDKTRDMGATWNHVSVFHHQWLFKADRTFLELSRKEDCVDTIGQSGVAGSDPGTLFGKHDYIIKFLPQWMLPPMGRKRMHLLNLVNRSRIDGESTTKSAGSSDRRTAILLDEMAKMDNGTSIKRSTKDVTACRLVNSTPDGPGTAYSKWRLSGQIKVFVMPFWEHPEKGLNRYIIQDEVTGQYKIKSPWYLEEEKIRTPKEMAIEIDMDHIGSGETFFEAHNLEAHRALFACDPRSIWTMDFASHVATAKIPDIILRSQRSTVHAHRKAKGPWRLWCELIEGRPDQTKNYVFGIDIGKGQGASNSTITALCVETREKVGEFADAMTPPHEFARIAIASALWFGGARNNGRPLLVWEANGPGWDFGRQVVKVYQYPFYFVDHSMGVVAEKPGKKYGWHSSREKKHALLGILRRAYAHGGFVNHSHEALDEAAIYIHYDGGGIGPASLIEESASARLCHGDRVISDMLSLFGAGEVPAKKLKLEEMRPPYNSIGGRLRAYQKRLKQSRKAARKQTRFDFRKGVKI